MKKRNEFETDKAYHLQKLNWSYPDIINGYAFLEDWLSLVTEDSLKLSCDQCMNYLEQGRNDAETLKFNEMSIGIMGIDEAHTILRSMKFILRNHFEKKTD